MALIVVVATLIPVAAFLAASNAWDRPMPQCCHSGAGSDGLLAYWWLHEALSPVALVGGALILTAVLVVTRGRHHGRLAGASVARSQGGG